MQIEKLLNSVKDYRVLFVGDGIIDQYVYVETMGKSSKEHIISTKQQEIETFMGGVWAAAAHLKTICAKVDIYAGTQATIKRRFVDKNYVRKLFEVHECSNSLMKHPTEPDFAAYDLVIVTDFGHGFVQRDMIDRLCRNAKFLAVNAQTNSANHGFNMITKYPRADYVVLDELEARLAVHDKDSSLKDVLEQLCYPLIAATLGNRGSALLDQSSGSFVLEPAYTDRVVDTMGAGDAFFAVTAPLAAAGVNPQDLLRVGNAAGAIKVGIVGHRQPVTRDALVKFFNESEYSHFEERI